MRIAMRKTHDFFTIDELCKYLRIAKGTIYKYSKSKKMPCFKVGRQLRFRKQSIDEWVKTQESLEPVKRKYRSKA